MTEAIDKYCKPFKLNTDNLGGLFLSHESRPWEGWIIVPPDASTSTVAHESFHATAKVMYDIGSNLSDESEEPYAYLVGYITNLVVMTLQAYDKKYPAVEGLENDKTVEIKDN